ncbi:MAG: DUF4249 family protein [Bacteroidales bacterium]|nr:DUF4249 family protein [Bacteroidales bacterium]
MAQKTRPHTLLYYIAAVFCAFLFFTDCVHKYDFYLDHPKDTTIVIEGMITNENKRQTISVSQMAGYADNHRQPISKAMVAVTASNDSTYYYFEDTLNLGTYVSEYPFVGVSGNIYYLNVKVNGTTYTAESNMLPVSPPEKITFVRNVTGMMSIKHVAESFVADNPAMYRLDLDWSGVEGYKEYDPKLTKARLYYYSLTSVDVSQLFAPKTEKTEFPEGTMVIERKYSIDRDYELFLRSLLSETKWCGGYFDEAHGNLHTNITNGAGFFAACTVAIDTVYAK